MYLEVNECVCDYVSEGLDEMKNLFIHFILSKQACGKCTHDEGVFRVGMSSMLSLIQTHSFLLNRDSNLKKEEGERGERERERKGVREK